MVTDFHSHILPHMDDGSRDYQMSIKLLQKAATYRITDMVATPHYFPERFRPESFVCERNEKIRELMTLQNKVRLYGGAEVQMCKDIDRYPGLEHLTIENTRCLLLELRHAPLSESSCQSIRNLSELRNLTVVIAHIDRYPQTVLRTLLQECPDVLFQVNASAICTENKISQYRLLIDMKKIAAIGSDVHMSVQALRNFKRAVKYITLSERISAGAKRELLAAQHILP